MKSKAHLERRLISALLNAAPKEQINFLSMGVQEQHFHRHDQEFAFVLAYREKYGNFPTARALQERFDTFRPVKTAHPLKYYVDQLRNRECYTTIATNMEKIQQDLRDPSIGSIEDGVTKFLQTADSVRNLRTVGSRIIDLTKTTGGRLEDYRERASKGYRPAVPSPWPTLNRKILMQRGEFVIIASRTSVGKTFLETVWAGDLVLNHSKGVGFLSPEMTTDQIAQRFDAWGARVDWDRFLRGRLSAQDYEKLKRWYGKDLKASFLVAGEEDFEVQGVDAVESFILQHNPEVVFIDSAHLLDAGGDTPTINLMRLGRGFKKLAKRTGVPIIASVQLGRKSETREGETSASLKDIQWSDDLAQVADFVLFIEGHREDPYRTISLGKGRNFALFQFRINFRFKPFLDLNEYAGIASNTIPLVY